METVPRQSVGLYDIRLHTKKLRYQKLHGPVGGGGRPLRLPPGSATGRSTPEYADNFGVEGTRDYATVRGPGVKGVLGT